jgi:RNA polymerase sigma-70 factor (ECF subfamily)
MARFQTTRWSLVLRARHNDAEAQAALAHLCAVYRAPVLAYLRHRVGAGRDAEDLTQAFFLRFLEAGYHASADPARGRFRTFLLTAVQRFVARQRVRDGALKRGGGARTEPLDAHVDAVASDACGDSPEAAFERAWAMTLVERALARLHAEAAASGKQALFEQLRDFLTEPADTDGYSAAARALGMRRNTIAVAVHRLRQRLRELVLVELAETVDHEADVEQELHVLRHVLAGSPV